MCKEELCPSNSAGFG